MKRASLTRRRAWTWVALASLTTVLWAGPVGANSPDPILGGTLFTTDQALTYSWDAAKVPDSWMQSGINAGAANSNKLTLAATLQGTKIATFAYGAGGTSKISMSQTNGCGPDAIACFTRTGAPTSFTVNLNRHNLQLQAFALKWCSWYAAQNPPQTEPASGCYDVANVTLDELGHVLILNHHDNSVAGSTYTDAVVQALSLTKPNTGWNAAATGGATSRACRPSTA